MDLSKFGEKIISFLLSARSSDLIPSSNSSRADVPARAAAAAATACLFFSLPPHQRLGLPSTSEVLTSIYEISQTGEVIEEVEDEFYEEEFDPVNHVLESLSSQENDLLFLERQATCRLAQLDVIAERLSKHVLQHHEEMVQGVQLVKELESDLKMANAICTNGRQYLTSSVNEVSMDLVVTSNSMKKKTLVELLHILMELHHASDMKRALEFHVEGGDYLRVFQILLEYLPLPDGLCGLSVTQEMIVRVEFLLEKTLHKLDDVLLGILKSFKEDDYLMVLDVYSLIGDVPGLSEKIQNFFMQEVLSETYDLLKNAVFEDREQDPQNNRLTYSDLCFQISEPKFRKCLVKSISSLFRLMTSYHDIMDYQEVNSIEPSGLRKDTIEQVSRVLQRARVNLWQLMTSRISVMLSSPLVSSTSTHQFLRNYEDLNLFILSGEAFSRIKASDFRKKLKDVCEEFFTSLHRQSLCALKMVLEKETWIPIAPESTHSINFSGLIGDGTPFIACGSPVNALIRSRSISEKYGRKTGFLHFTENGNPFSPKVTVIPSIFAFSRDPDGCHSGRIKDDNEQEEEQDEEEEEKEEEDLLADFIDEDSQLPRYGNHVWSYDEDTRSHTGSSLCLLRLMEKYARMIQRLEMINIELFNGMYQLFEMFLYFLFRIFDDESGGPSASNYARLDRIVGDCEQWLKPDLRMSSSGHIWSIAERCVAADSISLISEILHRSRPHLQAMMIQKNASLVQGFYENLVEAVPRLAAHIYRVATRSLLRATDHVEQISGSKWDVTEELELKHNGYVDMLLREFERYRTALSGREIRTSNRKALLESGVDVMADTLVEGISRVRRCTDEGRALMSLDLQVLINGLQRSAPSIGSVKPKFQAADALIKAYYLSEAECLPWVYSHPEFTKPQMLNVVNLVASTKGWKRKTRLSVIEKIESLSPHFS